MTTLANYITETRRLLHDGLAQYWTDAELIDYINEGRSRVVCDTGCNRIIQPVSLQPGTETYQFGGVVSIDVTDTQATSVFWINNAAQTVTWLNNAFQIVTWGNAAVTPYTAATTIAIVGGGGHGATAVPVIDAQGVITAITVTNGGTGYTSTPAVYIYDSGGGSGAVAVAHIISLSTLDILNISVIWGTQRIVLDYMPFTDFNARMRVWQQILSRPAVFSLYGQNTIFIGPIPDQIYFAELDCVILVDPLVNTTDVDVLSAPWTYPVAFYAAYKAKLKEQSYNESAGFQDQYKQKVLDSLRASYTRRIPNSYN